MTSKKNIQKNYLYNLAYEVFLLIVPILVTPYVSRVLGEESTGQYSFVYSIVTYFTVFAALGFGRYAQRLIAQHQGDIKRQSEDFWEVLIARLIPVSITLIVYLLLLFLRVYEDRYNCLIRIFTINIIAVALDITFFFQGNEEFSKIITRNIVVKALGFLCIFFFVKDSSDLWKYTLIQSSIVFFSNALLWFYLPKYLVKVKIKNLKPLKHIAPSLVLFLPTIAISIYTSLDKTLIGLITNCDAENGNYEYADRIVKMALTVITSLGTVMVPRNSQQYANGNIKGIKDNIYLSSRFVFFCGLPMVFGLLAVADNFVPWYLGSGYSKVANLIKILSPLIIIIGFSNVFGMQFLIPSGQDKLFSGAVIIGACINFFLNLFFISWWASYGAAVATVIAESVVTIVMFVFVKKDFSVIKIVAGTWRYWLFSLIMYFVCSSVGNRLSPTIFHTAVIVIVGVLIYLIGLIITKDDFVWFALRKIKR